MIRGEWAGEREIVYRDDADILYADFATKETIICAGAIDTPKLLLLSGIGPAEHLTTHNVPLVAEVPYIGSNLMDHPMIRIAARIKQGVVEDHAATIKKRTESQMELPVTQPGDDVAAAGHGYFKLDGVEKYHGFELLDKDTQTLLTNPLTAAYELVCVSHSSILGCYSFPFYTRPLT